MSIPCIIYSRNSLIPSFHAVCFLHLSRICTNNSPLQIPLTCCSKDTCILIKQTTHLQTLSMPCDQHLRNPFNSSSFDVIPSHLCRLRSNLNVGATFPSIKQVTLHTSRGSAFIPFLFTHSRSISPYSLSILCPFVLPFAENIPSGSNSVASYLENQPRRPLLKDFKISFASRVYSS